MCFPDPSERGSYAFCCRFCVSASRQAHTVYGSPQRGGTGTEWTAMAHVRIHSCIQPLSFQRSGDLEVTVEHSQPQLLVTWASGPRLAGSEEFEEGGIHSKALRNSWEQGKIQTAELSRVQGQVSPTWVVNTAVLLQIHI